MHAAALETACDDIFAGALDDAGSDTDAHGLELGIVHSVAVVVDVIGALPGLFAGIGMDTEGGEDVMDAALIEFVTSWFSPLVCEIGSGAVDGVGGIEEVVFGVKDIDDLDGMGEVLFHKVPDPGGAVAEDDKTLGVVEAAAFGFTKDAAGKGGRFGIEITAGDGLDGGIAGGGVRVADRAAVLVAGFGCPHDHDLAFACFGGTVGLLALAASGFVLASRDAGAVEAEIARL